MEKLITLEKSLTKGKNSYQYRYGMDFMDIQNFNKNEKYPMSIAKRIKQAREKLGLSQGKLSKLMGVTRPAVSQWENENGGSSPDAENLFKCAEALGVDANWLQFGKESTTVNAIMYEKHNKPAIIKVLPLLRYQEIAGWLKKPIIGPNHKTMRMAVINNKLGDKSFAYEVTGNAMVDSHDPSKSLVQGETAVVDPDMVSGVSSGQLVLAEFGSDDLRIRQYQRDGKNSFLSAFNNHIESTPISDNIKIIGVIVATYRNKL